MKMSNGNLLLGQALFRQEKWIESIDPLAFAGDKSPDERTRNLCNILRKYVHWLRLKVGRKLFHYTASLSNGCEKYDITLNLTLMRAEKLGMKMKIT